MRAVREIAATASALIAYRITVLPLVDRELRRWRPPQEKAKNAEAVAVFATLARRSERAAVTRAIVALQVAIDFHDTVEEGGRWPDGAARIEQLEGTWRQEIPALPGYDAVAPLLARAVERCAEGQRRTHGAEAGDVGGLESWAWGLPAPPGYRWWELAAGASSSVAAHALIAAAAAPGLERRQAELIDAAYNPSVGALTVLLDDLVDREQDEAAAVHNYTGYYADADDAAERIAAIADHARRALASLPKAARQQAILAGVAAFYVSQQGARQPFAQPIVAALKGRLGPSVGLIAGAIGRGRRSSTGA